MVKSFTELDSIQRDSLRAVKTLSQNQESVSGVDVYQYALETGYEESDTPTQRIYRALDRLVADGLVEKHFGHPAGNQNSYSLTTRGEEVLASYLRQVRSDIEAARQEVVAT